MEINQKLWKTVQTEKTNPKLLIREPILFGRAVSWLKSSPCLLLAGRNNESLQLNACEVLVIYMKQATAF